ncbi:ISAs1 family transposase [Dyadobacter tibetensis]|uniref:ISAs1 family transposase n=1 Tax=Dyadobacter tibetensis TaxID=1211851 RepID=UPI00046FAF99|nr:ISAs1 family transposase [Dyadobacter tibetensis]
MDVSDFFGEVNDYREEGRCFHDLSDIIMLVLCGYLADCDTFEDIYDYACEKEAILSTFLSLPGGIPSHDTLNRVFRHICPTELEKCLTDWGSEIIGLLAKKQLAVDGKQLRGTIKAGNKQANVQIVSVWAQKDRLCLGQQQVADKTNEINAIPELLQVIDIEDSIISIDAIGCQKKIVDTIIERKADYLIGLKQNQSDLYLQVQDWFEFIHKNLEADISHDMGHGRGEKREVWVNENLRFIDAHEEWTGLKSVVCVASTRWIHGKIQFDKRYFISSLTGKTAREMGEYVRNHWGIENQQHWHLDLTFYEDRSSCRQDHAPRNLTTIRKTALALLQREPSKMSLRRKRKRAARNDDFLVTLLTQLTI